MHISGAALCRPALLHKNSSSSADVVKHVWISYLGRLRHLQVEDIEGNSEDWTGHYCSKYLIRLFLPTGEAQIKIVDNIELVI